MMCGICGFWAKEATSSPDDLQVRVGAMTRRLTHRGPDSSGVWADAAAGLALGHARLSILDLSAAGHQPMLSPDGRYTLSFNGEIYNHHELRRDLEPLGWTFRGHSDTETILAAFAQWGVSRTLPRMHGMFALALWDRQERCLTLVRDRLGKKPLYYGWQNGTLLFSSELKALHAHPAFAGGVDRAALASFLHYNHVPAPFSIHPGIYKLPAGCLLELRAQNPGADFQPWPAEDFTANHRPVAPKRYWSAADVFANGFRNRFPGSFAEAQEQALALLRAAVSDRLISDVPLGAFLSGGIDSTLVVALMRQVSAGTVRTFTIGSHHQEYDEAALAKEVARHLGTEHTELYLSPQDALATIPELSRIFDEPFADPSQIPTLLVSRLARRSVTVALSGDGGDEFFGGYTRYFRDVHTWSKAARLPYLLRRLAAAGLRGLAGSGLLAVCQKISPALLPSYFRRADTPGEAAHNAARVLDARTQRDYARVLLSWNQNPLALLADSAQRECELQTDRFPLTDSGYDIARKMMLWDVLDYLPDDILVKVDRASMSCSLEARAPLLDHRLLEFSATLPPEYLIRNGGGKVLLKEILYRYVPRELIDRPKKGFGIPLTGWLRHELRDWAEEQLDPRRLTEEGFFRPDAVRGLWQEHLDGRRDWKAGGWCVLMFQAWLAEQKKAAI